MPLYCVAGFCSRRGGSNVSVFEFPHKRPEVLKEWIKFVQCKRKDFPNATMHSRLCSDHFVPDDFVNWMEYEMGFTTRRILKPTAIPSIHKSPADYRNHSNKSQPSAVKASSTSTSIIPPSPETAEKRSRTARGRNLMKVASEAETRPKDWHHRTVDKNKGGRYKRKGLAPQPGSKKRRPGRKILASHKEDSDDLWCSQDSSDDKDLSSERQTHEDKLTCPQERPHYRSRPQAGSLWKVAPKHKSCAMRSDRLQVLTASKGAKDVKLDPVTRKFTCVPGAPHVLPQLSQGQGSGQECRQPVLQSSGPASSERLGPQPCLSVCGPYPVMLIGPLEKRLLSKVCLVKARFSEEGECQSSLQVTQASQECAAVPVKVKLEQAEDSAASCHEEREVHQTPQEFAVSVKVKVEPLEEGDTRCFEKQEIDRTPQDFAVLPVEVKMEPDMEYSDILVQVKTEPPDS